MELDATAYFQCAKDDVLSVKQYTRTLYFAEKYMFVRRKYEQSVSFVNYVTDLFAQCSLYKKTIYYSNTKKNAIFNIHHLLFQNQYFFFLVNSSNLMDTNETIIVLIE